MPGTSEYPPGSPCAQLVEAARRMRAAAGAGPGIPAVDVAGAITTVLLELYSVVADYDASVLYASLDSLRAAEPDLADLVDDHLQTLENGLSSTLEMAGAALPGLPGRDGSRRAWTRSKRRLWRH